MLKTSLFLAVQILTSAPIFSAIAVAQIPRSIDPPLSPNRTETLAVLRASLHQRIMLLAQAIAQPRSQIMMDGFEVATNFPGFDQSIAAPANWQVAAIAPGVSIYAPPIEDVISWNPFERPIDPAEGGDSSTSDSVNPSKSYPSTLNQGLDQLDQIDGTRHPYILELSLETFMQHQTTPNQYRLSTIWEGEGYDRERDRRNRLISQREDGDDVHVTITYDASIIDKRQPNLMITVENKQEMTGQYTNISAFLMDAQTGEAIARQDFEQLPPTYTITLMKNAGFAGVETKPLLPRDTIIFAEHVAKPDLKYHFPLKLQADNQAFAQRQDVLWQLRSQGWLVKEVPPRGQD